MENHGVKIESCPRCGKQGLLIERLTVTKSGMKKYTYRKLNVAHYMVMAFLRMASLSIGFTGAISTQNKSNSYKLKVLDKPLHKMLHKTLDKTKTVI